MSYINARGEIVRGHRLNSESLPNKQNKNHRTSWLKFIFASTAFVGLLLSLLAFSNPTCEEFTEYLKTHSIAKENFSIKLLAKLRRSYCHHNLICSTAKYNNQNYIGLFGYWFENNMLNFDTLDDNHYIREFKSFVTSKSNSFNMDISKVDNVEALITIYVIVYALWVFILPYGVTSNHFTISRINLKAGRFHTLVTSAFSHNEIMHLAMNVSMLMSVGEIIQQKLNPHQFWYLYLFSAVGGSIGSLMFHSVQYQSLGASGALYGFYGYLAASDAGNGLVVNWWGINLNMSQALIVSLIFGAMLSRGMVQGADNAMHVAGAIAGAFFPNFLQLLK